MKVYEIPQKKKKINFDFSLTVWLIIFTTIFSIIFFVIPDEFVNKFIALDPFYILKLTSLWTFITSIFAHAGIFHLLINMFSLFFVGRLVEKLLGRKRYFWFYLISGIFAGLTFVIFYLLS